MVTYKLSAEEKLILKRQGVNQNMLRDYAPDEIAAMLSALPERARELAALAEFQNIPSLGIGFAKELIAQGYYSLEQLKGKSAVELTTSLDPAKMNDSNKWTFDTI